MAGVVEVVARRVETQPRGFASSATPRATSYRSWAASTTDATEEEP
jgi:hypothetical protein